VLCVKILLRLFQGCNTVLSVKSTVVSKEYVASIFRFEELPEQETRMKEGGK
jgi:hypothetical protein